MPTIRMFRSETYKKWHDGLSTKEKRIVETRVGAAWRWGILINAKLLDEEFFLYEFKWRNGLRVYFSWLKDKDGSFILLLMGGNKNSQEQNITESKKMIKQAARSIYEKEKNKQEKGHG